MLTTYEVKCLSRYAMVFFFCTIPLCLYCQTGSEAAGLLTKAGFENVSWAEDAEEVVYTFECSSYRLSGVAVGKAIEIIQESGLSSGKSCTLIVLDNNIPQISLNYTPITSDTVAVPEKKDWKASYELGESWKKVRKEKTQNSSLYKVDILVYPELHFRNYILSKVYEIVVNVSPVIEISLWKGTKLSAQIIFPIKNDYGERYEQIRPGFLVLTQTVRLPWRTFWTTSVGTFNNFRWGIDTRLKHVLKDERFAIEGRLGYTGRGYFDHWSYYHGKQWALTGSLGMSAYWPKYNTKFNIRGERYLLGEYGMRGEMMRHFRHASIGFYVSLTQHAGNKGLNGGFIFQIAIPPYKNKRKGYLPRINAGDFGIAYNAGNEEIYGKSYRSRPDDNQMRDNRLNPYFIQSELLN